MAIKFALTEPSIGLTDRTTLLWQGGQPVSFTLQRGSRGTAQIQLEIPDTSTYAVGIGWPAFLYEITAGPTETCVFAGTVDTVTEDWQGLDGWHTLTLTLVSLEQCFDTILVDPPISFFGKTAGFIVDYLLTHYAAGAPVTAGTISSGIVEAAEVYDHDRLTDVFDALATDCGFIWYVDPATQQLFFCAQSTTPAPFSLISSQILWETMEWAQTRQDFRNRQSVRFAFAALNPRQERLTGDGVTLTFTLPSGILSSALRVTVETGGTQAEVLGTFTGQPNPGETVTIDSIEDYTFVAVLDNTIPSQVLIGATFDDTAQKLNDAINVNAARAGIGFSLPTVFNGGFEAGGYASPSFTLRFNVSGTQGNGETAATTATNFSWASGTLSGGTDFTAFTELTIGTDVFVNVGSDQITTLAAVASGSFLTVTYYPIGQDCIAVEDTALVLSTAATEHGTGKYQQLEDDSSLGDITAAYNRALGQLNAFKVLPISFQFQTDSPLLSPGQFLTIDLLTPLGAPALVNADYVVQEVDGNLIPGMALAPDGGHFRYTVTVINAVEIGTYVKFWELLAAANSTSAAGSGAGGSGGGGGSTSPWGAETLATSGTVTPNGSLTYHAASLTGNLHINTMVGSQDGQPHVFDITCNGFDVTWDAAYVGLTNIVLSDGSSSAPQPGVWERPAVHDADRRRNLLTIQWIGDILMKIIALSFAFFAALRLRPSPFMSSG